MKINKYGNTVFLHERALKIRHSLVISCIFLYNYIDFVKNWRDILC